MFQHWCFHLPPHSSLCEKVVLPLIVPLVDDVICLKCDCQYEIRNTWLIKVSGGEGNRVLTHPALLSESVYQTDSSSIWEYSNPRNIYAVWHLLPWKQLHYAAFLMYCILGNIGSHKIWQFAQNLAEMRYWRNLNLAVCYVTSLHRYHCMQC